jgi:hypothetical protein
MLLVLPATWMSSVVFGFIFLHNIAESTFFVLMATLAFNKHEKCGCSCCANCCCSQERAVKIGTALTVSFFTTTTMLQVLNSDVYWSGFVRTTSPLPPPPPLCAEC